MSMRSSQSRGSDLVTSINIGSILNKRDEVEAMTLQQPPAVIAFIQTCLIRDVHDADACIPGYAVYRAERTDPRQGGIASFDRNGISVSHVRRFVDLHR